MRSGSSIGNRVAEIRAASIVRSLIAARHKSSIASTSLGSLARRALLCFSSSAPRLSPALSLSVREPCRDDSLLICGAPQLMAFSSRLSCCGAARLGCPTTRFLRPYRQRTACRLSIAPAPSGNRVRHAFAALVLSSRERGRALSLAPALPYPEPATQGATGALAPSRPRLSLAARGARGRAYVSDCASLSLGSRWRRTGPRHLLPPPLLPGWRLEGLSRVPAHPLFPGLEGCCEGCARSGPSPWPC